jgi:hypothetical protein
MEKLLLTVREPADVLSVSRSRVYELIYADSSTREDRSVSAGVASVGAALGGGSVGTISSRRP